MSRLLKIESLPNSKEWVDRDYIMLHACFQLLQDCVDKEGLLTHCDQEYHKEELTEVKILYDWWQTRKLEIHACDFNGEKKDSEMLQRLIDIRNFLWT